ncbi:hypothetical protein TELCIR_21614, partial [Teladorsagia circumcincta]
FHYLFVAKCRLCHIGSFGKVWTVECRKKPAQLFALKVPAPGFNPKHIAMELKSLIHKIPLEEALEYMRNLFIALHHIHRYRVIHRDIKPANFLYNRAERRYLLVDFGLSHFVTSNSSRKRLSDNSPSLKENVVIASPIEPPPA